MLNRKIYQAWTYCTSISVGLIFYKNTNVRSKLSQMMLDVWGKWATAIRKELNETFLLSSNITLES